MSESPTTPTMDTHPTASDGLTYKVAKLEAAVEYVVRELADLRRSQEQGFESMRNEHTADFRRMRDHQERDFRLLFSMMVAVALGLAGLIAKGFGWL